MVIALVNNAFALSGEMGENTRMALIMISKPDRALAERPGDGRFMPSTGSRPRTTIRTFTKIDSATAISARLGAGKDLGNDIYKAELERGLPLRRRRQPEYVRRKKIRETRRRQSREKGGPSRRKAHER
ncbi:hypothetical protein BN77_2673 [Rhizobium mesoamericanum STM3625]|uniref:Uncharacterized protein n=1 Tax=Rhizobium mesoamericanum STM3625 TaxID=1211777 RepID=K0PNN2_9HYPH|nr:hypothetical protein BN77_2673 [Rhizobium mesoamericanum STM3625]